MKRLPIGIQTFAKLRDPEQDYVYVDKTETLLRLVESGEYFFLSRPRRFGKSVMLRTLYELFRGNQDLFSGLHIEDKWDWDKKHPVIRISFGSGDFSTEEKFDRRIQWIMGENQQDLQVKCPGDMTPEICFYELIKSACRSYGQKTVILIDEYDKPILDHITDKKTARANCDKLKAFYSIIKDQDEYIRFVMITGVSKFAKMNLFSGLNNLMDISINARYASICGYTHPEVESAFASHLQGVDMDKLKEWYNGYNYFGEPVYNPFDILLFLSNDKEFRPYWWSTGNPSLLIDLLNEQRRYLPDLTFQRLFAAIPYYNYANKIIQNYEGYCASVAYAYLASLGLQLIAEDTTNKGRVDLTIILSGNVYVIEFKVDQPGKALEQIKAKGYHEKYLDAIRDVYIIGINFDSTKKNITEFEWERGVGQT